MLGGAGGLAAGGLTINKFQLRMVGILKVCIASIVIGTVAGGAAFFLSCNDIKVPGSNVNYDGKKNKDGYV